MAIIRCKMCGGELNLTEEASTAQCEYCGSVQTVPKVDDDKKLTLFGRANRLRAACEFDKAAGIYESIVADFPEEAEAYWGLVLCRYGIEYVDDPATGKKIPTCHRCTFDSIMEDSDFEQVLENADMAARRIYRDEAKQIEELRKGIISVSSSEQPYDIFICYKETDENGERTLDSVLAQDVYDALTDKGYRVFFSRITLEDKLGVEYEPYIFAALNSAKIMLAFGTDYEYFNAVWVKNEWGRYLKLMSKDKEKHLIPCYKGIDAYDMPKEFAKLQAQDLGKVGAIQDLLRGIEKLTGKLKEVPAPAQAPAVVRTQAENFVKRGAIALESCDWAAAKGFYEEALNQDAECAEAYLGLAFCDMRVTGINALVAKACYDNKNYQLAKRFASSQLLQQLTELEQDGLLRSYEAAKDRLQNARTVEDFKQIAELFRSLGDYADAAQMADYCLNYYEKQTIYNEAKLIAMNRVNHENNLARAVELLQRIPGWLDADELLVQTQNKLKALKEKSFANAQKHEKRKRILKEIQALEEEKRNTPLLFSGTKRKELDARIAQLYEEMRALN